MARKLVSSSYIYNITDVQYRLSGCIALYHIFGILALYQLKVETLIYVDIESISLHSLEK